MKLIHKTTAHTVGLFALAGFTGIAGASTFLESEPNDSKATANAVTMGLGTFTALQGSSTSDTGAGRDYFRVRTELASPGIYLNRLTLSTGTGGGHTPLILGRNQLPATAGPWGGAVGTPGATETVAQLPFIPSGTNHSINSWYGFGKGEMIYYRVTGSGGTSSDYFVSFSRISITPVGLGMFQPGTIVINTAGQTTLDTDLWVYDSGFNAIAGFGNDDQSVHGGGLGGTTQSRLARTFTPGVYYLALGRFNLANNMGSPSDDAYRTAHLLDYPDVVLSSSFASTTTRANFQIIDSLGTHSFTGSGFGPHEVHWYSFEVVPEPASMLALGMGALALAGPRLRKKN